MIARVSRETRQTIMQALADERLADGWDEPPQLLDVFGTPLGRSGPGTVVAITAAVIVDSDAWFHADTWDVLEQVSNAAPADHQARIEAGRVEHGDWLGVMFIAETEASEYFPELLNLTFVSPREQWAHMAVARGLTGNEVLPVVFGEEMPEAEGLGPGSLLSQLRAIARRSR